MALSKIFSTAKWIILPFLFGITINAIYSLIFLGGWLSGGEWPTLPLVLLFFALFLIGFPLIYYWLAKKHAVKKGAALFYQTSKPLTSKAVEFVVSSYVMGNTAVEKGPKIIGDKIKDAAYYIQNMDDNVPAPMQKALKYLLEQVPIMSTINGLSGKMELTESNLPAINQEVNKSVDQYIQKEVIGASMIWFWALLIVNIAIMILAWMYLAK